MPWSTPTLKEVRSLVRDNIRGSLPGADASVPNSVLRVLSDAQGGLCHLTLQYIDWLSLQLLPDTAEHEWLDRHADIWLVNADGTHGRKQATFAHGTVEFIGTVGSIVPQGTILEGTSTIAPSAIQYQTTADVILNVDPTSGPVIALDPGIIGNLEAGATLSVLSGLATVSLVTVVSLTGGTDTENDDDLRARVLRRIRMPPMGGAAHDYEAWALACPGVTRAWCSPLEMGIGTVTVRFMMDDLRADNGGFPLQEDIEVVSAYMNLVRPVAVKDIFVVAPIPYPVDVVLERLVPDTESVRAGIEQSVEAMLMALAVPGQPIYAAWKSAAIMESPGVESFHLINTEDDIMPSTGHMAVLGDIVYAPPKALAAP
jgi:uncharacterized phage protein gp47/JayE